MPTGGKRARFSFSVADDGRYDQVRIIEGGAEGVTQRVAKFASFVNRSWDFRCDVTWYPARERKLPKHFLHPFFALRNVRVDLGVGAFEPDIGYDGRTAVPRPNDINHIQVELFNDTIEVYVDKVESRRRAPMPDQAWFHMLLSELLLKKRIVVKVDLANRKIISRPPPGIHLAKEIGIKTAVRSDRRAAVAGEVSHGRVTDAAAGFLAGLIHSVLFCFCLIVQ